jgi:endonuclease/exonuclease/phosphatase family metal-dependent hydrolase
MRSLSLAVALSLLVSPAPAQAPRPSDFAELRVMTFNIWRGGEQVDLDRVIEAIRAAQADVVGIQEAEGNLRAIADGLGWRYADERLQVVSRYPLIDPPDGQGIYTFVELRSGRIVAMANVHLPSDPYGPDAVRDGASPDSLRVLERAMRLTPISPWVRVLPELAKRSIPVVLTGDFNSPSPADWTAAVARVRAQVKFAFDWPATSAVLQAGLRDSYREVHRDPVRRFGLTWTPGYPSPRLRPNETFDRIDYVFAAGPVRTLASRIVGEPGGPDVDVPVARWPADHRAIVSTFQVTPAAPPVLVAVGRRSVAVGEELAVRFHAPGERGERVAILPAGGDPARDALMSLSTGESPFDGTAVFGTQLLAPGDYEAALLAPDGRPLARIPVAVLARGALPELTVERPAYAPGEPVVLHWRNAPGNRWDWVGLYRADDTGLEEYLVYRHTGARISGTMALDRSALSAPLPPGRYRACLLRDDGYVLLAATTFEVTARAR